MTSSFTRETDKRLTPTRCPRFIVGRRGQVLLLLLLLLLLLSLHPAFQCERRNSFDPANRLKQRARRIDLAVTKPGNLIITREFRDGTRFFFYLDSTTKMGGVPSVPTDRSRKIEVIGAGYSRTGTVSMSLALEKLLDGPVMHGGTQIFGREDCKAEPPLSPNHGAIGIR